MFSPVRNETTGNKDLLHSGGEGRHRPAFSCCFDPSLRKIDPDNRSFLTGNVRFNQRETDINSIPEKNPGK